MLFAYCIGTAFILDQMGCIKKAHDIAVAFGTNIFIVDNYYYEDKSDYYIIEVLSLNYYSKIPLRWWTDEGDFYAARDYACFMQLRTKIFFPP